MSRSTGQVYGDTFTQIVDNFPDHKLYILRWVAVTSSVLSLIFGLAAFYLYARMRRRVFRHHLILLLLLFDFGKALVLLWYPARVLTVNSAYNNINFCDVVGWFTSVFIEGADLAVLALAVHTALLVFSKSDRRTKNGERGLYVYRYYVYALTVIIPAFMASIGFVHRGRESYMPFVTYCYLPIRPIWYRLVLSWIPRYLIIIAILTIYISIYIYVKMQYRSVVRNFRQSQQYVDGLEYRKGIKGALARFGAKTVAWLATFPGFAYLDKSLSLTGRISRSNSQPRQTNTDTDIAIMEFQRDSVVKFQIRRSMIERQVKSIFIYPGAYVFLWLAPFALQCLMYRYVINHGPVYWLTAITAFMMPFNCVVDSVAFAIREQPWNDFRGRLFTKDNMDRVMRQASLRRGGSRASGSYGDETNIAMRSASVSNNRRDSQKNRGSIAVDHATPVYRDLYGNPYFHNNGGPEGRELDSLPQAYYGDDGTDRTKSESITTDSPASTGSHSYSPKDTSRPAFFGGIRPPPPARTVGEVDPFSSTARRIDVEKRPDNDTNDDDDDYDEHEIDLLEFLR